MNTKKITTGSRFGKKTHKWTPGQTRYRKRVRCPITGRKISVVTKG